MSNVDCILRRLSESQDKAMLKRRLNIYKVNNRDKDDIQRVLAYAERMLKIRR